MAPSDRAGSEGCTVRYGFTAASHRIYVAPSSHKKGQE